MSEAISPLDQAAAEHEAMRLRPGGCGIHTDSYQDHLISEHLYRVNAENDRLALTEFLHRHEDHELSFTSEHAEDGGDSLMCETCDTEVELNALLHGITIVNPSHMLAAQIQAGQKEPDHE